MVRLERVSKVYRLGQGTVSALDDVSVEVPRGQFVSVMGPSGSGKSTLLNLVGGLDAPSSGEIYIEDKAISGWSDDEITIFRRRRIGFIFQFFNLLPTLSAEENVALPLLLDGRRLGAVRPQVSRVLDLVGLSVRRAHRPAELSGGEMQRVAVARALVTEPALMLADEPTGNLDSKTGESILDLLQEANRALGQTIIMVTHDPKAAAFAERSITIADGRIAGDVSRTPAPRAEDRLG
jgi:putative ABC transport system ATP-binding protein